MAEDQRRVLRLRALAADSRRRLLHLLEEPPAPRSVPELAEGMGLHPNTIRLHLGVLEEAGLVAVTPASPTAKGRPPVRYRAVGEPTVDDDAAYRRLAGWLAPAVAPADAERVGFAIGAGAAAAVAGEDRAPGCREALVAYLAADGFDPEPVGAGVALHRCPYEDAVDMAPDAVCALHRGILAGFSADSPGEAWILRADPRGKRCAVSPSHAAVAAGGS